ncbi:MAG: hypothetical protein J3Q66DRAFT_368350 [Benniella sp.]|nr:MAG: hypothetical protein J3Q66DRAFT_368345 [Benniella sp.]KAK3820367.1 MAG: hypothetical protein J3Q66DRAFT_368350 [Benniella sp.]
MPPPPFFFFFHPGFSLQEPGRKTNVQLEKRSSKANDLSQVHVEANDAPWFWKACERLEKLRMVEVSVQGAIPQDLVFNRLRQLYMSSNWVVDEVQMDLMYRSSMLGFLRSRQWARDPITVFEPHSCELGAQSSMNLSFHFTTLVSVDLRYCDTSTRSTAPDMLCNCPNGETNCWERLCQGCRGAWTMGFKNSEFK